MLIWVCFHFAQTYSFVLFISRIQWNCVQHQSCDCVMLCAIVKPHTILNFGLMLSKEFIDRKNQMYHDSKIAILDLKKKWTES